MNHETLAAYMTTLYRIHTQPAIDVCIGETNAAVAALLALHRVESAVFVTAFNPLSRRLSDEQNAARQHKLAEYLDGLKLATIEGAGIDPTGAWPAETSLLALGATSAKADDLMREFEQNAVVVIDRKGTVRLLLHPQLRDTPSPG
ncbi:hypothetical protein AWB67_00219 [Caballeronia terrestris]|uniref:DUF3293 domain-containing protein n=1 Tax=Caballeronia terrestris TaxID=1226301 RepID=A0A158F047_9BURK|nr:DUF3293 domain-containing protein [Caballeronia terrestris]SAL13075.1 hypothetical protein AWB67_00219 [Caballeronia terrestris]